MAEGDGGQSPAKIRRERKGKIAAYALLKKEKVGMLKRWLEEGGLVVPQTEQAREMVEFFVDVLDGKYDSMKRIHRNGKKSSQVKRGMVRKLDDLGDSVLQGMVWLQWQRNFEQMIRDMPEFFEG